MGVEANQTPESISVRSLAMTVGVPRQVRRSRVVRRWMIAWGGAAAIGVANALLREAAFNGFGELRAHQLSTVTLLVFLAGYMWAVERWERLPSTRTAVQVGVLWAGLTVLFEFALGLLVTRQPLSQLLDAYDLTSGHVWALVPLCMAVGPAIVRRLRVGSAAASVSGV